VASEQSIANIVDSIVSVARVDDDK
jgi:hypothetical protein